MFALVLTICYLGGGCEDLAIDAFDTKQQCMVASTRKVYATRHVTPLKISLMVTGHRLRKMPTSEAKIPYFMLFLALA